MAVITSGDQVFQAEALMLQLCSPNEWHFYRRDKTDTPVAMPETFLAMVLVGPKSVSVDNFGQASPPWARMHAALV